MDSMNEIPLALGREEREDSQRTLESARETSVSPAAKPLVARRDEDLLGVRRQRDLARLSHGGRRDFGHVADRSPEGTE
jgi:hypothetical protein